MMLGRYSARQVARRPGRATLTLLGIAVGVASMVSIAITTRTTQTAHRAMFDDLTGRATLEVVAESLGEFDPAIAKQLQSARGVKAVVPVVQKPAAIVAPKGTVGALVLGIDLERDRAARDYSIREGTFLTGAPGLMIEASAARAQGLAVGDSVRILTTSGAHSLPVVGLLEPRGAANSALGTVVMIPLDVAQKIFAMPGKINAIQLVPEDGVDDRALAASVAAVLPEGLSAQVPAVRGAMGQESLRSTEQALAALSVVSLVAGGFVILNTFRMSLGERRRQFAILRSLGATRRQVTSMLLREALALGGVGTLLGMGLGVLFALALTRAMSPMLGTRISSLVITPEPFWLAALLGPGISLAATYLPARQAGRRHILPELLGIVAIRDERHRWWPILLGLAMIGGNLCLLIGFFVGWFPLEWFATYITPAMTVFLVGAVLAIPLFVWPLERPLQRLLEPLLGIEARLALRQLSRRGNRTSLTVGVLVIAMVVTLGMGNSILNNMDDVREWHDRAITADYYVRSVMPNLGTLLAPPVPAGLSDELRAVPGVAEVYRISFLPSQVNGERFLVLARDFPAGPALPIDIEDGDAKTLKEQIARGEGVLGTVLARRLKLGKGDTLELVTRKGRVPIRVAATTTEYTVGGMILYLDFAAAQRILGHRDVDCFMIAADKTMPKDAVASALGHFCQSHQLMLQSNQELHGIIDQLVEGVDGLLWMLMALAFLVASLGIVNTLTMNVLEQTRELGVLRAVAMTRGQVRRLIWIQAGALGLYSLLPGALAGIGLAYLVNMSNRLMIGHPVPFVVRSEFVMACGVVAVLTAILASLLPAERAARLDICQALQYE